MSDRFDWLYSRLLSKANLVLEGRGGGVKQAALNVDVIYLPLSVRTSQEINTTHELSSPCYVARVNAS